MGSQRHNRKRPCRICRKWFTPNPRLGDRQRTCGAATCQQEWHRRECAKWNRRNRTYFQDIHLQRRLNKVAPEQPARSSPSDPPASPSPPVPPPSSRHYPRGIIQEVIGAKQLVIIEYLLRLLLRGVQAAIPVQPVDSLKESRRLPPERCSSGDSPQPPSQLYSG